MISFSFLDHLFFTVILILSLSLVSIVLYSWLKITVSYFKDGDIRHVFLAQSCLYIIIVVSEALLYIVIGCANDFCIVSLQLFVFVNSFLYAQTRYTGRAALKIKRMPRAFLFVITLTAFWLLAFFYALSANSTFIFLYGLSPYEKLSQIVSFLVRPMNDTLSNCALWTRIISPFIFNIFALIIDYIEDKPNASKINSACMFIPTFLQAYLIMPIPYHSRFVDIILLIAMVFSSIMCILHEGYLIKYYNEMTMSEAFARKLYKEIRKEENYEIKLLKQKMLIKMFSYREVKCFKDKKLQKYIQQLQCHNANS